MEQRPVLAIPASSLRTILDFLAVAGILGSLVLAIHGWQVLPDRIPHHFNLKGEPDRWGGKSMLFFLPVVGAVVFSGLKFVARFPHRFNFPCSLTAENARTQYSLALSLMAWIRLEISWLLLYIEGQMYRGAKDASLRLSPLFLPLVVAVIAGTIVLYLVLARRNRGDGGLTKETCSANEPRNTPSASGI